MAYSRWSDSNWYTYDLAHNKHRIKNERVFTIMPIVGEVVDLKFPVARKMTAPSLAELFPKATPDEIDELFGYLQEWIQDVKSDHTNA